MSQMGSKQFCQKIESSTPRAKSAKQIVESSDAPSRNLGHLEIAEAERL
jgi:predicted Rdx family selenoprotein